jgi:hypothetical protein
MPSNNHFQIEQIILNIIGGFLASLIFFAIFEFFKWCRRRYFKRGFKQVFGKDAFDDFNIVYGKMVLLPSYDKNGKLVEWPYAKPGTNNVFRISSPVSFTATKSAKYIGESFGRNIGHAPNLISDEDIKEKLDISYCSIGGLNNYKTIDTLESEENRFYKFTQAGTVCIVDVENSETKFSVDGAYDYGMILKVVPKSFPDRVRIVVAGLGEPGTGGASWFLSRNWKEIKKIAKNKPFGLIVRVKAGKDESAEIVHKKVSK